MDDFVEMEDLGNLIYIRIIRNFQSHEATIYWSLNIMLLKKKTKYFQILIKKKRNTQLVLRFSYIRKSNLNYGFFLFSK